jgi:hypothetical protein
VPAPPEAIVAMRRSLSAAESAWRIFGLESSGSRTWIEQGVHGHRGSVLHSQLRRVAHLGELGGLEPGMRSACPFMSAVRRAASSLITIQRTESTSGRLVADVAVARAGCALVVLERDELDPLATLPLADLEGTRADGRFQLPSALTESCG